MLSPSVACDEECAGINNCRIGGYRCKVCGARFCACELDENSVCGECRTDEREDE